ncbi:RHS repeat-associated core domain-containing protein [Cytophagaceae bacterium ABcell3]|nr:RHS repeat-associated core domain-containing protein [Cytophagaceae bacterium ABcell3]
MFFAVRLYSIINDYLGTPKEAYDKYGDSVWKCEHETYGKVKSCEGEVGFIPFRFQGQYHDVETGLYYNRFRYYAPDEAMYVSQDPIGLSGGDRFYGYVHDCNSIIDPYGLMAKKGDDAIRKIAPLDLGDGYRGRKDIFNYKGLADYEIHVYKVKGKGLKEVGVMNSNGGWINKHGHKEAPSLPNSVSNKLKKICKN